MEVAQVSQLEELKNLRVKLQKLQVDKENLALRSKRGSPYYDVLRQFFPS